MSVCSSGARYNRTPPRDLVIEFMKFEYLRDPKGWVTTRSVARRTGMSVRNTHACLTKMVRSHLAEKKAKVGKYDWNLYRLTEDGLAYPASRYKHKE